MDSIVEADEGDDEGEKAQVWLIPRDPSQATGRVLTLNVEFSRSYDSKT